MSNMQWIIYGVPALTLSLALAGYLVLRHSAHQFDKKYGRPLPPAE